MFWFHDIFEWWENIKLWLNFKYWIFFLFIFSTIKEDTAYCVGGVASPVTSACSPRRSCYTNCHFTILTLQGPWFCATEGHGAWHSPSNQRKSRLCTKATGSRTSKTTSTRWWQQRQHVWEASNVLSLVYWQCWMCSRSQNGWSLLSISESRPALVSDKHVTFQDSMMINQPILIRK